LTIVIIAIITTTTTTNTVTVMLTGIGPKMQGPSLQGKGQGQALDS